MTAKERQLWYWQGEMDSCNKKYQEALKAGNEAEAERWRRAYWKALQAYEEVVKR